MYKIITLFFFLLSASGCATTTESIFTGTAIGGTTGAVIGHQHSGDSRGRMTGALVGATLGGVIGYLSHKHKKKNKTELNTTKKKTKDKDPTNPFLTRPRVRVFWVPDKIEGNRYIERHRVWEIKSNSKWSLK